MKRKEFHSLLSIKQFNNCLILYCMCPNTVYEPSLYAIGRSLQGKRNIKLKLKNVQQAQAMVTYEVNIDYQTLLERTLFYVVDSNGERRAWRPGIQLSSEELPNGFYFSYRFQYLIFDAQYSLGGTIKNDFYSLDNITVAGLGRLRLHGVLFHDQRHSAPSPCGIKVTKYRDDRYTYDGKINVQRLDGSSIYNRSLRNYEVFNRLGVLEFTCDVSFDKQICTGCYFLNITDGESNYPLKDFNAPSKNKSNLNKTTYLKLTNWLVIKCTFYYDFFAQRWKLEIIRQNLLEYALERVLNKLHYFGRFGRYFTTRLPTNMAFIAEYSHTAKDNGAALYNYIRECQPNLNVYYVIERSSEQIEQLQDKSKILFYGSIKHQLYSLVVKYLIFTHYPENALPKSKHTASIFNKHNRFIKCFIQHGVIATTASVFIYDFNRRYFDLFFVSSKRERDLVSKYLHYPEQRIIISGLARWDNLRKVKSEGQSVVGNTILVMPTWRNNLISVNQRHYYESHYYKVWSSLFSHPRLSILSKSHKLKFVFVPHIAVAHFQHSFEDYVEMENVDQIQALLKEAQLFITDFSSVAFDMVYMEKPVIFFPFDLGNMVKQRKGMSYIDYEKELPGEVIFKVEALVQKIIWYIEHDYQVPTKFETRRSRFVGTKTDQHCQHLVQEIFRKPRKNLLQDERL